MSRRQMAERLLTLRKLMLDPKIVGAENQKLKAYIIPTRDAHNNEYLCDNDKRREFVTGFWGSNGSCIVTAKEALLWTDGRYYLQATQEMDPDYWALMKFEGPSMTDWLARNMVAGDRIGVDPLMFSANEFLTMETALSKAEIRLVPVKENLVDRVWRSEEGGKPGYAENPVVPLGLEFAGEKWESKVERVRREFDTHRVDYFVATMLDDIAWLLNLRGSDIVYNPVFFSYVVITSDKVILCLSENQVDDRLKQHLKSDVIPVEIRPYSEIFAALSELSEAGKKGWFDTTASYALVSGVKESKRVIAASPIGAMKSIKNPTELKGFEECHIRDAAALCNYFAWLEKNVKSGEITEVSGAEKLATFRQEMKNYVGPSFDTISSVGSNAAIIHYKPVPGDKNKTITDREIYLVDSGGQYKDGTTDVTRTLHFGVPTDFEKECFTRVVKGVIRLATAIFPEKITGNRIDCLAREPLWEVGLDYAHGTGHGVGSYLNVHEGPMGIGFRPYPNDNGLQEGMVLSDEPGFYLNGQFGTRTENLVKIVEAKPKHGGILGKKFLTFEQLTLVPLHSKLIEPSILTSSEVDYINDYHQKCREKVGSLLKEMGHTEGLNWLMKETEPIG